MFRLSLKKIVKTALLLGICCVDLQAQVTFHGLSLYAPISEIERLVDELKLKDPGTMQRFYVAHRNGLKFNLEFVKQVKS